ncbi:MFS transporter [Amycolatopsis suaedae]|uniref:MFS transporter n=1 Tax=Amycolatopsis suaedae TaxID=2510978 RepID=A0A4Q7J6W9_9PSEU|nr:MFS transporter [Amycolatopsis suaedae]RZQ62879.1 MFS transporter [Amycolatopsis suaedae]
MFALLYAPQPLLPQLAAEYSLDPGTASLAVGVATGGLAVGVLPIASLSEVAGRRPVILVSVLAAAVLGLLLPLAPNYPVLLAMRAVQGLAVAGFAGVAAAYLAERLGKAGVAAAVGAMIAGNTVGGMVGRVLSGVVADHLGLSGALLTVGAFGLACALLTVFTLPPIQYAAAPAPGDVLRGLGAAVRRPVLLGQYAVAMLAMGSFVALYNAAGFRLTEPPLALPPAIASLVFLAYAMGTVSSSFAGRLIDRFGRVPAVVGALAVTVAGAGLTIVDSLPLVAIGFAVLTGGFFAAHAVANGTVAAESPPGARGQAAGLYTLAYYLGSSVGGTVGTVVFDHAGWTWLIGTVTVWLTLSALAAVAVRSRH